LTGTTYSSYLGTTMNGILESGTNLCIFMYKELHSRWQLLCIGSVDAWSYGQCNH